MSLPPISEELIKDRSKAIRELMKSEFDVDVSHGQCLKIVSQLFGFKNWNTAKAEIEKDTAVKWETGQELFEEVMSDPIESLRFIRDRDEALAERDPAYASQRKSAAYFFNKANRAKKAKLKTIGEVRKALEPFEDSDSIDANYSFMLKEITDEVDEFSSPQDEIGHEFVLALAGVQNVSNGRKLVSFDLILEHSYLSLPR